jgi:hypothetical protein
MDSDLLDPAVRRSMRVLVESEVMGEQLFGIAERHARTSSDRRMWEVLHALEEQTRKAVFARLVDYVLAHEYAIAEVGRRALTHADDAVEPVETLLGNVPA